MDRKPSKNFSKDYIEINVGGKTFPCSKSTLMSSSNYFESRLAAEWYNGEEVLFVDQDPAAFRTLLGFMRHGFINASELTDMVLIEADFLGIEPLVNAVKCAAYRFMHNYQSQSMDEHEICLQFDYRYGGIVSAVRTGILPKMIHPSQRGQTQYIHLAISSHSVVIPPALPFPGKGLS